MRTSDYLRKTVIPIIALLGIGHLHGASVPDRPETFHRWIVENYAFSPHSLNKTEISEKSKLLDAIWETVKTQKDALLPLLRDELRSTDQSKFFYYDGSSLLLSLSKSKEDQQLAAIAIARCDVRDVQYDSYFYTVRSLTMAGVDAIDAALNVLTEDGFTVIVPAHALTLGADYALIFMLNGSDPKVYVPKLITAFETNPREKAKSAALTALWYSLDPTALDYVQRIKVTDQTPPDLRSRISDLQSRTRDLRGKGVVGFTSEAKLREKRRETLRRVSDEALYEYESLTLSVLKKMK